MLANTSHRATACAHMHVKAINPVQHYGGTARAQQSTPTGRGKLLKRICQPQGGCMEPRNAPRSQAPVPIPMRVPLSPPVPTRNVACAYCGRRRCCCGLGGADLRKHTEVVRLQLRAGGGRAHEQDDLNL